MRVTTPGGPGGHPGGLNGASLPRRYWTGRVCSLTGVPRRRAVGDLLIALNKAGATEISAPVCAECGKHLRTLQRRGDDWYCGVCGPVREPCSECGRIRPIHTTGPSCSPALAPKHRHGRCCALSRSCATPERARSSARPAPVVVESFTCTGESMGSGSAATAPLSGLARKFVGGQIQAVGSPR